jgi:type I restriction enzyme M protein
VIRRSKGTLPLPLEQTDPRAAIAEFEQILVSNSGEDAFDVAVRLLAAKLVDELVERETGRQTRFTLQAAGPRLLHEIEGLYGDALRRWPDFNGSSTDLGITHEQLARCMRPLVGWRMLGTDLSHLDAVLERLVARDSKGELGQYFTPRDVIRLCTTALNPHPRDRIIDPACGSGAFLFEAARYASDRYRKAPACLGIDFGARALKVAYLLATASCPGAIKISKANSLDGRGYAHTSPAEWDQFLGPANRALQQRQSWGSWHRLSCSLLLTNPPFAGDVDEPEILAAYESQRAIGSTRKGAVGREHLFLERAVNLLQPGGRLAIVLPQGLLANPTASYLRRWVLAKCRLLGVVGLHPLAFVPNTGVKTSLLFLERVASDDQDYPVLFTVSKQPGKDSSGRRTRESDYSRIGATLASFFFSHGRPWAAMPTEAGDYPAETVAIGEIVGHDRFDAEYYDQEVRRLHFAVSARATGVVGDCVARSIDRFRNQGGEIDYLDISSVDAKTGTAVASRIEAAAAPSRATYLVQPGDVLVSTVRPDRNTVALVSSSRSVPVVASNGFCVLRPRDVQPEVLYAYCRTDVFRKLLARRATASMYPAVTDRDVLEMPFVKPPESVADAVTKEIRAGLQKLEAARANISNAIQMMDGFAGGDPTRPDSTAPLKLGGIGLVRESAESANQPTRRDARQGRRSPGRLRKRVQAKASGAGRTSGRPR